MGIKHFFSWYRNHQEFKNTISKIKPEKIDHVLIDMNGLIHEVAQQVYNYGKYSCKSEIILPSRIKNKIEEKKSIKEDTIFILLKNEVNKIIINCSPKKTVFLGIDGVAPKGKQNQQRQRRFRAVKESNSNSCFDSTCITAGTDFMNRLSNSLLPLNWLKINPDVNVILSSDSIPGEGEHKLIEWIRKYQNLNEINEIFCVVGMDADLILLCLCLKKQNVFIMRENEKRIFDWIDINFARNILKKLKTTPEDLVIWSCFIGNDFLPAIPSLEIKESYPEQGALDFFFDFKKSHLVNVKTKCLNISEINRLLSLIAKREFAIMNARLNDEDVHKQFSRFPNKTWKGDIDEYRKEYFEKKLIANSFKKNITKSDVVFSFMKTVYWVYIYYTEGISDWDWFYPFNYSLHASEMVENMTDIIIFGLNKSNPSHPHEQLLRVIPVESKSFIPEYLWEELERINKDSFFKIDKEGKRQLWEAITIVNFVFPQISFQD
jgi:5'-3' exonuclease